MAENQSISTDGWNTLCWQITVSVSYSCCVFSSIQGLLMHLYPTSNQTKTKLGTEITNSNPVSDFWKTLVPPCLHPKEISTRHCMDGDVLHFHGYTCAQTILASSLSWQTSGSTLLLPVLSPSLSASKFVHGATVSACSLSILTFHLFALCHTNLMWSWWSQRHGNV